LDDKLWGDDVRADGLVIGRHQNGAWWVCFAEMKSQTGKKPTIFKRSWH